jgi:hypothetical protein
LQAEVHVFETLPGARLGHLAQAEGSSTEAISGELESLTPSMAAMLVGQPALGRLPVSGDVEGRRLVRIVVGSTPLRRYNRVSVRVDTQSSQPSIRVALRLTEREARVLSGFVRDRKGLQAVAGLRGVAGPALRSALVSRLLIHSNRVGLTLSGRAAARLGERCAEAMITTFAANFASHGNQVLAATQDPRAGITLRFDFRFGSVMSMRAGSVQAPTLHVLPGVSRA